MKNQAKLKAVEDLQLPIQQLVVKEKAESSAEEELKKKFPS